MICSICNLSAAVRLYGKFRNGRDAQDLRCADHAPTDTYGRPLYGPQEQRPWAFCGTSARMFRVADIERIAA